MRTPESTRTDDKPPVACRGDEDAPFAQRVIFVLALGSDFRYGACVYKPLLKGWVFIPNVNNRRPSKRAHSTAKAAIPQWCAPYRLQPKQD